MPQPGNAQHLPGPTAAVERTKTAVRVFGPILIGVVTTLFVGRTAMVLDKLKFGLFRIGVSSDRNVLERLAKVLLVPIGIGIVAMTYWLYRRSRMIIKDIGAIDQTRSNSRGLEPRFT